MARNPENTVFDAKRLIGRKCADQVVVADCKLWPFKVIPGAGDKPPLAQQKAAAGQAQRKAADPAGAAALAQVRQPTTTARDRSVGEELSESFLGAVLGFLLRWQ